MSYWDNRLYLLHSAVGLTTCIGNARGLPRLLLALSDIEVHSDSWR